MKSLPRRDLLIVGQGLAGSHLALEGIRRGHRVTVVDLHRGASSSRISAGLLNPAAGRRFTLQRDTWQQWRTALQVYRYWEKRWNLSLLDARKMWRPFVDERERFHFQKRLDYAPAQSAMREATLDQQPDWLPANWRNQEAVLLDPVYLLNVPRFLDRALQEIQSQGTYLNEWLDQSDLQITPEQILWKGKAYSHVVFSEGGFLINNPLFDWIPFQTSKGSILDFPQSPAQLSADWVLNRKHWFFTNCKGLARLGATAHPPAKQAPIIHSPQPLHACQDPVQKLLETYQLQDDPSLGSVIVNTGYRPRVSDNQPLVGQHPRYPSVAIINATGGRGGILLPFLAMRLMAKIDHNLALPQPMDCRRNFPAFG